MYSQTGSGMFFKTMFQPLGKKNMLQLTGWKRVEFFFDQQQMYKRLGNKYSGPPELTGKLLRHDCTTVFARITHPSISCLQQS